MMEEDCQVKSNVLLEETFYITSKKNTYYKVKLCDNGLSLHKESNGAKKIEKICISDIIGCRCMRLKKRNAGNCICRPSLSKNNMKDVETTNINEQLNTWDEYDTSTYLYIYSYISKKKRVKTAPRRERLTLTLRFRTFDKYEDNLREASKWRLVIKCLINNISIPKNIINSNYDSLNDLLNASTNDHKKLLVLLNPKSGPGRGRELFQQRIHPILSEAEKPYDVHITKYPNYAREFIKTRDIYQWNGIICVGGDGILFEVVNGIFERQDWENVLKKLPLGVIPCGSGNGLAKSIAYAKDEPYDTNPMLISALSVVKCQITPIDIIRVETINQILYSFLSIGWGIIADIDIESERLRAIGGQRFFVWSVARLLSLRRYKGVVSYLPCDDTHIIIDNKNNNYDKTIRDDAIITHSKSYDDEIDKYCDSGIRESKSCHNVHDDQVPNDIDDLYLDGDEINGENIALETGFEGRRRLDSFYSATSRKSAYFSTGSTSSFRSMENSDNSQKGNDNNNENRIMYGPPTTLPALTAQVPSNWTKIEGEFISVHASYQSHIGQDCLIAPQAKLADGVIWLIIIKAGVKRSVILQFLLALSNGSHVNIPGVDMIPVKAFRIEPSESTSGHITVDGEEVDYGPIQAEVFPSLANVMSP